MKTRKVEVYIGYADHTWDTKIVELPGDTPSMLLETVAGLEAMKLFLDNPNSPYEIAFIGVYNSDVDDEEEE